MGYDKRMEDKFDLPEMNGTLKSLLAIISAPMNTKEKQAAAIRDMAMVTLHSYMMQKKIYEKLDEVADQQSKTRGFFIDRVLPNIITFIIMGTLWLVFTEFKP